MTSRAPRYRAAAAELSYDRCLIISLSPSLNSFVE